MNKALSSMNEGHTRLCDISHRPFSAESSGRGTERSVRHMTVHCERVFEGLFTHTHRLTHSLWSLFTPRHRNIAITFFLYIFLGRSKLPYLCVRYTHTHTHAVLSSTCIIYKTFFLTHPSPWIQHTHTPDLFGRSKPIRSVGVAYSASSSAHFYKSLGFVVGSSKPWTKPIRDED